MNRERLIELAEWLEAGAPHKKGVTKFNMSTWLEPIYKDGDESTEPCGTVCCIAGAAVQFFHDDPRYVSIYSDVEDEARELLDLPYEVGEALFVPDLDIPLRKVKPEQAAKVVRHLAETGEVNWSMSGHHTDDPTVHIDDFDDEFGEFDD